MFGIKQNFRNNLRDFIFLLYTLSIPLYAVDCCWGTKILKEEEAAEIWELLDEYQKKVKFLAWMLP